MRSPKLRATSFRVLVVGAPLRRDGQLFNCAVVIHRGAILGAVPKTYLPNYREFYEARHFATGRRSAQRGNRGRRAIRPVRHRSSVQVPRLGAVHGACRDLRGCLGSRAAIDRGGARRRRNPAQPVGQQYHHRQGEARRLLCASSRRAASPPMPIRPPGRANSTTDLAWDGQAAIFENGVCLARPSAFPAAPTMADRRCRLGALRQERMRVGTFGDCVSQNRDRTRAIPHRHLHARRARGRTAAPAGRRTLSLCAVRPGPTAGEMLRGLQHPGARREKRLQATQMRKVVIGVSGGLGFDPGAYRLGACDGPARAAAFQRARLHVAGLCHLRRTRANARALIGALGVTGGKSTSGRRRGRCSPISGIHSRGARWSTT